MDALRVGLSLRALRIRRGLRQVDLSAKSGVPREVISELERGIVARVSLEDVDRISQRWARTWTCVSGGTASSWIGCSTRRMLFLSNAAQARTKRPRGGASGSPWVVLLERRANRQSNKESGGARPP